MPLTEFYGLDDPEAALERHFQDLETRPFLAGEEGVRLSLAGGGGRKRRRLPPKDALALLDQVLFNILVANTDAHAKNYSILRPVGGGILQPSSPTGNTRPLAWHCVTMSFNCWLRRLPAKGAGPPISRLVTGMLMRPTPTIARQRKRVQKLVDAFVAKRVEVTRAVCELEGAAPGYVEQAAALVEANAVRIGGRLRGDKV